MVESSWKYWTIFWLIITIVPSLSIWIYADKQYFATLIPSIVFWIYEIVYLRYVTRRKIGSRHILLEAIEKFNPTNQIDAIDLKASVGVKTFATMASVSFTLMVFSLGFIYLAKIDLGFNANTAIIFTMISSLTIAGIVYLIGLDQYDVAVDPSLTADLKWQMRKFALPYFIWGRDFLIFALIAGVSLIHPLLTLITFSAYIFIHDMFLFQPLK